MLDIMVEHSLGIIILSIHVHVVVMVEHSLGIIILSKHVCAGMYGQLGHGSTEKQSSPRLVKALEGSTVYLLACGNFHTVSTRAFALTQTVFLSVCGVCNSVK